MSPIGLILVLPISFLFFKLIDDIFVEVLEEISKKNSFFMVDRDPNVYKRKISFSENKIVVENSFGEIERVETEKLKHLKNNPLLSVIKEYAEIKKEFRLGISERAKALIFYGNSGTIAPTRYFFMKEIPNLSSNFLDNLEEFSNNLIEKTHSDLKTIQGFLFLYFNSFFNEHILLFMKDCMIAVYKGEEDVLLVLGEHGMQKLKNILAESKPYLGTLLSNSEVELVIAVENSIILDLINQHGQNILLITMDLEEMGYSKFLGIKTRKEIDKKAIEAYKKLDHRRCIEHMSVEGSEDIGDKIISILNSENTTVEAAKNS